MTLKLSFVPEHFTHALRLASRHYFKDMFEQKDFAAPYGCGIFSSSAQDSIMRLL